jgi:competence protein ComEC
MNWWVLKKHIHTSWLIATASAAILIGVYLSKFLSGSFFASSAWCIVGLILMAASCWRGRRYVIPIVIVGGLSIGLWRGSGTVLALRAFTPVYNHVATVTGSVTDDVDTDTSGQQTIRMGTLEVNNRSFPGTVWVSIASDATIRRGDTVTIKGKLGTGFGSFAASMYRASLKKIIEPHPGDVARQVRDWFADAIHRAIPDPQASLGVGYLVGQKRALPVELIEALQIVGLTHVVVASGYNLTILVRLARRLFVKISKYLSALAASIMIACFVAVTGASPSMTRAGIVSGLSLVAWYYGRRFHPLVLLPLAATITVLINPSYAWGDLGWQLSFAAFGGVMILAPLLQRYFFGEAKPSTIRQILGETISAQIVTAPVLIAAFGQLSNVAIVANLLVLPFVPLAMLLTFIAGVGGLVVPSIAWIIGLPANWLLGYMVWVSESLSKLSWATTPFKLSELGVGLCYMAIIGACLYLWRATKYNLRDANIIE